MIPYKLKFNSTVSIDLKNEIEDDNENDVDHMGLLADDWMIHTCQEDNTKYMYMLEGPYRELYRNVIEPENPEDTELKHDIETAINMEIRRILTF